MGPLHREVSAAIYINARSLCVQECGIGRVRWFVAMLLL